MLTFSDRFCAFRKDAIVEVGGCARNAANPVLELLARLHRLNADADRRYRIAFLPAPILWRTAPATPRAVCRAAANQHHGLTDALKANRSLFWRRNSGSVGHLAFPFVKLTEVAGPSIEVLALVCFVSGYALGVVSVQHLIAFAICSAGLGILVSWLAILLDAFVFRTYQSVGAYFLLLLAAIFENIGFRQLTALCMLPGIRWRPTHSKDPKQ